MEEILLINCGATVAHKIDGSLIGIITAACIRFGKVSYEVSYIYNGESKTAWMNECEFTIQQTDFNLKIKIGFDLTAKINSQKVIKVNPIVAEQ